jgi:hypothetical protein
MGENRCMSGSKPTSVMDQEASKPDEVYEAKLVSHGVEAHKNYSTVFTNHKAGTAVQVASRCISLHRVTCTRLDNHGDAQGCKMWTRKRLRRLCMMFPRTVLIFRMNKESRCVRTIHQAEGTSTHADHHNKLAGKGATQD